MAEKKDAPKRDLKPGNKVTITAQRNGTFYVYVAKRALANFEVIELHSLGIAMSACVSAADALIKYKRRLRH